MLAILARKSCKALESKTENNNNHNLIKQSREFAVFCVACPEMRLFYAMVNLKFLSQIVQVVNSKKTFTGL